MAFLPQDTQDVSGLPLDENLAKLELQRRLKIADALKQAQDTQGQMVSGHYVAPSWTQSLANLANKYIGSKTEEQAVKQYNDVTKARQAKMADVLKGLTPHTEEVQLDVNQAGGMPGVMQTQQVQPDVNKAIQGMTELNPDFGAKIAETYISKAITPKEPNINKVDVEKFKPESIAKFAQTGNYQDLVLNPVSATSHAPQIQQLLELRKTLDPKSPDYKVISDAIRKESTFAPNAMTIMPNQGQVENAAQLIANGQIAPLSGFAMRSPYGQAVMSRVKELNPEYSGATFSNVKQAEQKFNVGKQGDTVRSLNVAVNHLDTLGQLSEALNNNDINLFNKLGNAYAQQTGNPIPTNFNAAKKIVADEIVKGIVGSGGGVADREEAAASINAANSPAQLKGVIDTYKQLLGGQLSGLKQQYEVSTGKKDFNKFISPNTQKNIGDHSQSTKSNVPAIGEIRSGYKFKGGNPADQNSWEKM